MLQLWRDTTRLLFHWNLRLLLLPVLLLASQHPAGSVPRLRVGYSDFEPYFIIEEHSLAVRGFALDVVNEAARREGVEIQWVRAEDPAKALRTGQIDIYPIHREAPELSELHFSKSWWDHYFGIVLLNPRTFYAADYTGINRVAVRNLPMTLKLATRYLPNSTLVPRSNLLAAVESLCSGNAEALFLDMRTVNLLLAEKQLCGSARVHFRPIPGATFSLGMLSAPAAAKAADRLTSQIGKMQGDGSFSTMATRWSLFTPFESAHFRSMLEAQHTNSLLRWSVVVLALVLATAVFSLRQVRIAHREQQQAARRLQQLVEELDVARLRAESAASAKSAFLTAMSHEIRTPMNAIIGMGDLLSQTSLTFEQSEYLGIFRNASTSLLTLIDSILDLAKVESGRVVLSMVPFDSREIVDSVVEMLAPAVREKGLEIASHVADDVPAAHMGDPARLRQILLNIVGNAVKFTENGSIAVRVEMDSEIAGAGGVRFSVSDTGIGIPPDKLDVIFDKFTQADPSTTRKYGGTGLGLAICKQLVEVMGGRIWVESEIGRGSTFHFAVPMSALDSVHSQSATPSLQGGKALVIESDSTTRLEASRMLIDFGAAVTGADSGNEGITEWRRAEREGSPYSLVLLDARACGVGGFNIAEATGTCKNIPAVIVMWGAETEPGNRESAAAGSTAAHLRKPLKRAELAGAIQTAVNNSHAVPRTLAEPSSPVTPQPLRILLAEDTHVNVLVVQSILKSTGCVLDVAGNGEIAYEKFIAGQYDMVLMDVQMPVMDGYTATRLIRKWEAGMHRDSTPVFALTAHALPDDVTRSLDAGCTAHITKPVRREELLALVRDARACLARVPADPLED